MPWTLVYRAVPISALNSIRQHGMLAREDDRLRRNIVIGATNAARLNRVPNAADAIHNFFGTFEVAKNYAQGGSGLLPPMAMTRILMMPSQLNGVSGNFTSICNILPRMIDVAAERPAGWVPLVNLVAGRVIDFQAHVAAETIAFLKGPANSAGVLPHDPRPPSQSAGKMFKAPRLPGSPH